MITESLSTRSIDTMLKQNFKVSDFVKIKQFNFTNWDTQMFAKVLGIHFYHYIFLLKD